MLRRLLPLVLVLSLFPRPPASAIESVGFQVFLPNVTKQLGGPGGWTTPVVLQNMGGLADSGSITVYRLNDGVQTAVIVTPLLRPGQAWAFDPGAFGTLAADAQFSLVVSSRSAPFGAIVLEGSGSTWMAYAGATSGSETVHLPLVTRRARAEAWSTPFVVQNVGGGTASFSVSFHEAVTGTAAARLEGISLLPGRARSFLPWLIEGLADGGEYTVTVQGSPGARLHAIVNAHASGQAMSYEGLHGGTEDVYLPNVVRFLGGTRGWWSQFVVRNLGTATTTFSVAFHSFENGSVAAKVEGIAVEAGRGRSFDVRAFPIDLADGQYSVVVRGAPGARLGAVVAHQEPATGRAMANAGLGVLGQSAYLPLVRKRDGAVGWSSPVIAQNAGIGPSDITITLFDAAGAVAQQRIFPTVQPGSAVVYDPRYDRRLADGAYAALVQANERVAAVANHVAAAAGDHALAFVSTTALAVAVPAPPAATTRTINGVAFTLRQAGLADVLAGPDTSPIDAWALLAIADVVVPRLEQWFGRPFAATPSIYVFPTAESFIANLQKVFGHTYDQAQRAAENEISIFVPGGPGVVVNAEAVGRERGTIEIALRHELSHLMAHQLTRGSAALPAWLDDGLAELQTEQPPKQQWHALTSRYTAASMAATDTLFTLEELTSRAIWNARSGRSFVSQHYPATEAARFLVGDLGAAGVVRILELLGAGQSFDDAYRAVAGKGFDSFTAAYPQRIKALAPSFPGIATAPDTPFGEGVSIILYGFAPGTFFTITLTDPAGERENDFGVTNAYGTGRFFIAPSAPPGRYVITVDGERAGARVTVSVTTTKP